MTLQLPLIPPDVQQWLTAEVPDMTGRRVLVTGANSGIGLEAARLLASRGAHVFMGCRSPERGEAALHALRAVVPEARVELLPLDLASLGSVRAAAETLADQIDALDLLINNAGVMAIARAQTAERHEMQFGTNHLGHFALTAQLWPLLMAAPAARVVAVSSMVHRVGRIDLGDLMGARRYDKWRAYAQSKLANLLFIRSLTERRRQHEFPIVPVACHPGYAATNLQAGGPRSEGSPLGEWLVGLGNRVFAQSALMGALPTVLAATGGGVVPGDYFGPAALGGWRGFPRKEQPARRAMDLAMADHLWGVSESLTGERFPWSQAAPDSSGDAPFLVG